MSLRTPYRETRRKLLFAFDVGTTFSGVSYRYDVIWHWINCGYLIMFLLLAFWILDKYPRSRV